MLQWEPPLQTHGTVCVKWGGGECACGVRTNDAYETMTSLVLLINTTLFTIACVATVASSPLNLHIICVSVCASEPLLKWSEVNGNESPIARAIRTFSFAVRRTFRWMLAARSKEKKTQIHSLFISRFSLLKITIDSHVEWVTVQCESSNVDTIVTLPMSRCGPSIHRSIDYEAILFTILNRARWNREKEKKNRMDCVKSCTVNSERRRQRQIKE